MSRIRLESDGMAAESVTDSPADSGCKVGIGYGADRFPLKVGAHAGQVRYQAKSAFPVSTIMRERNGFIQFSVVGHNGIGKARP